MIYVRTHFVAEYKATKLTDVFLWRMHTPDPTPSFPGNIPAGLYGEFASHIIILVRGMVSRPDPNIKILGTCPWIRFMSVRSRLVIGVVKEDATTGPSRFV